MFYTLFSVDWFNENVQDLVGTDGVVTFRFRVQLLALMGLNAFAAFLMESLSGGVVALIRKYRPVPPVQLLYTTPKVAADHGVAAPVAAGGGAIELQHHALPALPHPTQQVDRL